MQLEQSPFLSLVSDRQIQQVLGFMKRPPETPLTVEVAQAICERTGSAAILEGSIVSLGNQYVLWLRAKGLSNRKCPRGRAGPDDNKRGSSESAKRDCDSNKDAVRRIVGQYSRAFDIVGDGDHAVARSSASL